MLDSLIKFKHIIALYLIVIGKEKIICILLVNATTCLNLIK